MFEEEVRYELNSIHIVLKCDFINFWEPKKLYYTISLKSF